MIALTHSPEAKRKLNDQSMKSSDTDTARRAKDNHQTKAMKKSPDESKVVTATEKVVASATSTNILICPPQCSSETSAVISTSGSNTKSNGQELISLLASYGSEDD